MSQIENRNSRYALVTATAILIGGLGIHSAIEDNDNSLHRVGSVADCSADYDPYWRVSDQADEAALQAVTDAINEAVNDDFNNGGSQLLETIDQTTAFCKLAGTATIVLSAAADRDATILYAQQRALPAAMVQPLNTSH